MQHRNLKHSEKTLDTDSGKNTSKQSDTVSANVRSAGVPLYLQRSRTQFYKHKPLEVDPIQPKLQVGAPGDEYEQEADRVADEVMRMPDSRVQRQIEGDEGEEEPLQAKSIANNITQLIQRQEFPEEEEELMGPEEEPQTRPEDEIPIMESVPTRDAGELEGESLQTKSNTGGPASATPGLQSTIHSLKGGGQPLAPSARAFFEPRFGRDFSDVRVHTDHRATQSAQSIHARAFTVGRNIVFGSGEYAVGTPAGRKLLAHELTHVMQQNGRLPRKIMSGLRLSATNQPLLQREVAAEVRVNDRAAIGGADIEELFAMYASVDDEFNLPSSGATFTRDWIRSDSGTALIRGHIRAQLANHLHESVAPFAGMREWFTESIDRTAGDPDRLSELLGLVDEAFDRIATIGLEAARRSAAVIMDTGTQGSTFSVRETRASARARTADPSLAPVTLMHAALDAPSTAGEGIYVPLAGRVIFAGSRPGFGNIVRVLHESPPVTTAAGSGPVVTSYAHMNEILVSVDEELRAGQAVGTVGNTRTGPGGSTGRVTIPMGMHLHFSVQRVTPTLVPTRLSSEYERDPQVRVRPDSWLSELGVSLSMGVAVEDRAPSGGSAPTAGAIHREASIAPTPEAVETIQRTPLDDNDPVTRMRRGLPLPYREATQLLDCMELMGESGRDTCYQQVLGIPAPVRSAGASTSGTGVTSATATPAAAAPSGGTATSLNVSTTGVVLFTTASGNFYRFPAGAHHTNYSNRPQVQNPASVMVVYSGAGSNGTAVVHPAVVSALDTMMTAMHAEGVRLDDESLKQARISNGFRGPTAHEGSLYLAALRRTIARNPMIFGSLTFPSSLETMAQSELGFSGSTAHRAFQAAVAAAPGWTAALAAQLINITAGFKAPRGGSTHHSGVVVDIDFPYATSSTAVNWHGTDRANNANAFRSAAGVWLNTYATSFNFDTYNTNREIWHQEWRNWAGTAADPAASTPTISP